jgi:hypothetical protein
VTCLAIASISILDFRIRAEVLDRKILLAYAASLLALGQHLLILLFDDELGLFRGFLLRSLCPNLVLRSLVPETI